MANSVKFVPGKGYIYTAGRHKGKKAKVMTGKIPRNVGFRSTSGAIQ